MQSIKGEASGNLHTLDYFYGEYWFDNRMEATSKYAPVSDYPWTPEEISAEKGDVIGRININLLHNT
ncbi:unnamed protein product [Meloidogyne enterolobii]|uniref:Uncharacterized protein n=1 Tax=Meloidogyne enterolobii TaxID=390850 RepID=A0ACB0ZSD5_MELEN